MEGFNIRVSNTYTTLSDTELERVITDIQNDFPNSGYTMMAGHLLARGHRVQQIRIRESMIRIDPDGVASRWFRSIQRRSYQVYGPMALWHLDGMHKFIRYVAIVKAFIMSL